MASDSIYVADLRERVKAPGDGIFKARTHVVMLLTILEDAPQTAG